MGKQKKRKLTAPGVTKKNQLGKEIQPQNKRHSATTQQPTIPFEIADRILLIGDGDLSFAKSLIEEHGCCEVTATCYDTKHELYEKYTPQAQQHVAYIETEGQTVLCGIDATKLDSCKPLRKGALFDRIMFNFPHVGGRSKDVNRQVRFNQEMLVKFFAAALAVLAPAGTIIVTLFDGEPYTLWNIRDLARHSGLEVQRSFKFMAEAYPGYTHARTLGNIEGGGGWKGEDRPARSYVFQRKGEKSPAKGKKRRRDEDSSDDEC